MNLGGSVGLLIKPWPVLLDHYNQQLMSRKAAGEEGVAEAYRAFWQGSLAQVAQAVERFAQLPA